MLLPLHQRTISYDIVGPEHGPVVVFSHSLAADLGLWAEQVSALLAAGYRVLRTDLRGHGGSTATPAPYTIDLLADDVIDVLDALQIERCHFVGLSIGGMIGQSLGLRHAHRLHSLMLCDTQSESPPDAATFWGPMIEAINKAGSLEGSKVAAVLDTFNKQPLIIGPTTYTSKLHIQTTRPMAILAATNGKFACVGRFSVESFPPLQ